LFLLRHKKVRYKKNTNFAQECQFASRSDEVNGNVHETFNDVSRHGDNPQIS